MILSESKVKLITWILLALLPITGMIIDLIAPSLPAITHALHVSRNLGGNLISTYLFGYALGNFFTGFLTDSLGRQKLLRISLIGFIIVTFLPVIFPNIILFLGVRVVQGLTLGSVAVLIRAIWTDILPPEKLVHFGTIIGTMWGLGPIVAPVIGGYLQFYFGWQSCFYFLILFALILLIPIWLIVPETLNYRHPFNINTLKNNFLKIIKNSVFIGIVLIMGLTYSFIIAFQTAAPFFIQTELGHSSIFFGHLALTMGCLFLIATFVSRALVKKFCYKNLLFSSIHLFFIILIIYLNINYFLNLNRNVIFLIVVSGTLSFALGIIFPMSMGKGISLFREISGSATAVMYLLSNCITTLSGFIVSFILVKNNLTMMLIYFALLLLCAITYWGLLAKKLGAD